MRINQNIAAFNAYNNLNQTQNRLSSSLEKLSSGFRINRAADDASGLVNSENLRSQIGGLKVATRNAQDSISLVQTAEGAQTEVHSILQRMRDLTVEAGNLATNDDTALQANQDEIAQLQAELNRVSQQTQFGTQNILDGSFDAAANVETTLNAITTTNVADADAAVDVTAGVDTTGSTVASMTIDFGATTAGGSADGFAGVVQTTANVGRTFEFTLKDDNDNLITADVVVGEDADATAANVAAAFADLEGYTVEVDGTTASQVNITSEDVDGTEALNLDYSAAQVDSFEAADATFQVGANEGQRETVGIKSVDAATLGVNDLDVSTGEAADIDAALRAIDGAIETVSANRAELGAFQNRMESLIRNVSVAVENLSAAESRIRDTDMALEMVEFTRNQILSQAGTAMLAQANVVPQSVLSLLG